MLSNISGGIDVIIADILSFNIERFVKGVFDLTRKCQVGLILGEHGGQAVDPSRHTKRCGNLASRYARTPKTHSDSDPSYW